MLGQRRLPIEREEVRRSSHFSVMEKSPVDKDFAALIAIQKHDASADRRRMKPELRRGHRGSAALTYGRI